MLANEGKSAAGACHQVAEWVPDMFCNFYLVKSHKTANNSASTEAREKISTDLESVEFLGWSAFSSKRLFIETAFHRMACSSNAQLLLIFKTVSRISVALLHPQLPNFTL